MATLVASWLGPEPEIVEDEDLSPGEVRVELGEDFKSVSEPSSESADGAGESAGESGDGDTTTAPPESEPGADGGTGHGTHHYDHNGARLDPRCGSRGRGVRLIA